MTFDSLETKGITTRRLRYAFVASLLVHVVAFWPVSVPILSEHTPSLLQTTLRPVGQPVAQATSPKPQHPAHSASPIPPPAPSPVLSTLDQPRPLSVPRPPAVAAEKDLTRLPAAVPVPAPAVPAAPAGALAGAVVSEADASGEAIDGLRGYRLALAAQARRFKRYPAQATASGWSGRADVRVEIGADGRPQPATLVRSSGHEPLDRAALTMIDAGALRARLPETLRGKAFAVVLPVVFEIEDE